MFASNIETMKELTKAEEQIMQVLWKRGKSVIRDIISDMGDPKPAYNTVATFLKILEKKEFVGREPVANAFFYFPLVEREDYTEKFLGNFTKRYFEGSVKKMISFFIDNDDITIQEFEELQQYFEKKKRKK